MLKISLTRFSRKLFLNEKDLNGNKKQEFFDKTFPYRKDLNYKNIKN
ncbi:MAG: hypothetical protein QT10_C0001G0083 [archaeon GW2011_AR19]|nr:MAG: hypothetical protein QT10_C0001G0083 [archaeon GW2011_AR19]